jgi:PAS domain S-box-containing protein
LGIVSVSAFPSSSWSGNGDYPSPSRILVLNSYYPGHPVGDDFIETLKHHLQRDDHRPELYIEYMDTDRYSDTGHLQQLLNIYDYRYKHLRPDAIISFGENALEFLRRNQMQLFGDTPVVFAGVPELEEGMLSGYSNFTGITMRLDPEPTMRLIISLQPEINRIVLVSDDTSDGRIIRNAVLKLEKRLAPIKLISLESSKVSTGNLLTSLGSYGEDTAILFASWSKDKSGVHFSSRMMLERIAKETSLPVYGLSESYLGNGIVGGHMYSAKELGTHAASLAMEPLRHHSKGLAVETIDMRHYGFDARQLKRFRIDLARLPRDAVIIGREISFYERYKVPIWVAIGVLSAQAVTIIFLVATMVLCKRAEYALKRSEQTLDLAIRGADLGLWSWHIPGRRLLLNDRWAEILGYRPQDIPPEFDAWLGLVHPDDRAQFMQALQSHLDGKSKVFRAEHRMLDRSGGIRWTITRGKIIGPDTSAPNSPQQVAGTHLDITEQREAENQRNELRIQLIQRQKIESIGELAGGVAHDMNNLLSPILGFSDMALLEMNPEDSHYEDLIEIRNAGRRARDLVAKLLAFGRKQLLTPVFLSLNQVVEELKSILSTLIREDIRVVFDLEPGLWTVYADPIQIQQILINLVVNARDAMIDSGQLIVKTRNSDSPPIGESGADHVLLSVSDTGMGMTDEVKQKIFEPFFTTKEKGQGTGLGLATVYGIVKQHKGYILVDSTLGKGARFEIYLPRAYGIAYSTTPIDLQLVPSSNNETILLAEDDEKVCDLVERILTKHGFKVLCAGDGEEALTLAREYSEKIHLLLSDVIMPKMNGCQLCRSFEAVRPGIPVIFMSGYSDDVIANQGVVADSTMVLMKPFHVDELLRTVRTALQFAAQKENSNVA